MVDDRVMEQQTVEVSRDRVIVQCRGERNALPSGQVVEILRQWAAKENLTLSGWFRRWSPPAASSVAGDP